MVFFGLMARKPNYGIDSPGIVIGLLVVSGLAFASTRFLPHLFHLNVRWLEWIACIYFLAGALGMLNYNKSGKLRFRDRILASLPWRGDESVLDVGCGRGLLLIGAAQRLDSGRAVGVDVWLPAAIVGNKPKAVLENAKLMGVGGFVRLAAGDARRLPFRDASFDILVSNYVIHEVNTHDDRKQLASEMVRVLKPGGHLAVTDFIFTREFVDLLRQAGMQDAERTQLGGAFSFWLSAILSLGTTRNYLVTASKPNSHM